MTATAVLTVWYSGDDDAAAVWLPSRRRVYAGGLFTVEARGGDMPFTTRKAAHVHPADDRSYAYGCYTLRQAARLLAELAGKAAE